MTVSLSDNHRRWLEDIASRRGSSVDAVIAELVDDALESEDVETKVLEGLSGPPAEPLTSADWERLHRRISDRSVPSTAD